MIIWRMEIVNVAYDNERYKELILDGFEPFHFVLIPAPPNAGELLQSNGGTELSRYTTTAAMMQVVGLRKPYESDPQEMTDEEHAAFEREILDHDD